MTTNNTVRATSPRGIAKWPKLSTPDEYQGKVFYATSLVVAKGAPGLAEFCKKIEDVAQAHFDKLAGDAKTPVAAKKIKAYRPNLPFEAEVDDAGDETGNVVFKFKTNATYKDKAGVTQKTSIRFFDAFGNPCKVNPWGGTEMKVSADLFPFENAAAEKYGVSLRISAVQIIKLKTGGSGADASEYGFSAEEDGFAAQDAPTEEQGQVTQAAGNPNGGDF